MTSHAWGHEGHKAVMEVALRSVKKKTLERLKGILSAQSLVQTDLQGVATWPDLVRSGRLAKKEHHTLWHYVNYGFSSDGTTLVKPELDNVESRLVELFSRAQSPSPSKPKEDRARSLAWISHLIGDIHQPLHSSAFSSAEFRKGDRGGTLFKVPVTTSDQREVSESLHGFWDKVFFYQGLTFGQTVAKAMAVDVEAEAFPSGPAERKARVLQWGQESLKLAKTQSYRETPGSDSWLEPGKPLSESYRAAALDTAIRRVARAGRRLAKVLDALYGN